ncbi:helix-turn-helix domain-containing protein [Actinoplanes bogorensis]|uniref:Helix-turn-helix domain-containing protein n=1 Tax=Paractinoplanes bogorensis TaxID=1610840 RepID=A0ABS5YLF4_9ACTN|nr:helix-turn-helix domain-containing protein [Actinoplanes bogorensis]MBU2663876.1 helix-turn-helix domain-containing protein [Actinoplanes bogorensis]
MTLDESLHLFSDELYELEGPIVRHLARLVMDSDGTMRASGLTEEELVALVTARHKAMMIALHRRHVTGDADTEVDESAAQAEGAALARHGVPLAAALLAETARPAYVWEQMLKLATTRGLEPTVLVALASDMFAFVEREVAVKKAAWLAESSFRAAERGETRAALIEALFGGAELGMITRWEAAELLRLPRTGPYVVVVAAGGGDPAAVERALDTAGFRSAWRERPDTSTGIVALPLGDDNIDDVVKAIESWGRFGMSPVFERLDETARAVDYARIAAVASAGSAAVTVFDRHPLAVASAAAPEVTARVARHVLAGLDELEPAHRRMLLDTFQAWLDADGSTAETARVLFLHRNSVRQRLARFEQLVGRSLSSPQDVTELTIALWADRRNGPVPGQRDGTRGTGT